MTESSPTQRPRHTTRLRWPLMAALMTVVACGEDGAGPDPADQPTIQIEDGDVELYVVGDHQDLQVTLSGGATGPVTWSSSDASVVTVSDSGRVTAVGNGAATVRVQAGDGPRDSTMAVVDATSWLQVAAGERFACALAPDGAAYCWGDNGRGQIGNGSDDAEVPDPAPVSGGVTFISLDVGEDHACGVAADGAAHCWGSNGRGRLGVGDDREGSNVPVSVAGGQTFSQISAGGLATCGVTLDGEGYCWGDNRAGQVGDGTLADRDTPTAVLGDLELREIHMGSSHACALTDLDAAFCWGLGLVGSLGSGDTASATSPVAVDGGRSYAMLSSGDLFTCAVELGGAVYCWGMNEDRELGSATGACNPNIAIECSATPVLVSLGSAASQVSVGGFQPHYACALVATDVECWGMGLAQPVVLGDGALEFSGVAAGFNLACVLDADGAAHCWAPSELTDAGGPVLTQVADRSRPAG